MICSRIILVSLLSLGSCFVSVAPPIDTETAVEVGVPLINAAVFNQLIDHNNPSLGTFQQRYWYSTEFWNGPGSPVSALSLTGSENNIVAKKILRNGNPTMKR